MAIGAWVLVRKTQFGLRYWRGQPNFDGRPGESAHRCDAFHFTTARAAYECAQTHPDLDPEVWRAKRAGGSRLPTSQGYENRADPRNTA